MGWFEWAFFYGLAGIFAAMFQPAEASGLWTLRQALFWPLWIVRSLPGWFFHAGLAFGRMMRAKKIDDDWDPDALTGNMGTH